MRRCMIIFAVVVALLVPTAYAQSTRDDESGGLAYSISLGLGSAKDREPDEFRKQFDPSFGMLLGFGVQRSMFEVSGTFDYNFFLSSTQEPYDYNVLMLFLNFKISPFESTARPYVIAGGGLFSNWVVDLDEDENVLGYHVGAGLEFAVGKTRHIFLEGRYVQGQTRKTARKENTVLIPARIGITWIIQ